MKALSLVLVVFAIGCRGLQETPTALSPSPIVPSPAPAPAPPPSGPPFAVRLEIVQPQQTNAQRLVWTAYVTVEANTGLVSPALPARVEVDCGTGAVQQYPGFYGTSAFPCSATTAGTFETRAIATAGGFSAQATERVSVAPNLPPFNIELQTSGPSEVMTVGDGRARTMSFSVLVTPDTRLAQSFEFDFGDGTKTGEISHFSATHLYTKAGTYEAVISVKSTDGRSLKAVKRFDIVLP